MQRACGVFGITDVLALLFTDNPLEATPELHRILMDIFYEVRPHIVIAHAPFNFPHHNLVSLFRNDHPATGQLL